MKYYDESMEISLPETDDAIYSLLEKELERQRTHIELIASENFTPRAIMEATGSVLANKYAEGYPKNKYYGGCEFVEEIEQIAIDRAKELFGADHANVQPHSGSTANQAVYFTVLNPGDTLMAMRLDHGGHLTHGHPINFSGKLYNVVGYGVDPDSEIIDYDEVEKIALRSSPKAIVCGASAYPRKIDFARFRRIADRVGACLITDMAHIAGLVAGNVHENPVPHSDFVTSTTHKTLRGPRGAFVLCTSEHAAALDRTVFPGLQGGPILPPIAGKATCFKLARTEHFAKYAKQIVLNAAALAEGLTNHGFRLVSGGTDNHLILTDLRTKKITGKEGERILGEAGITANKNAIPFDTEKPMITSGLRFGTAAMTTRGMKEPEMLVIADAIDRVLSNPSDGALRAGIKKEMAELCEAFPLYATI